MTPTRHHVCSVSISDPDVHYYDQRSPSAAPFVSVGNPARLPYAKQKNTKYIYKFPSTKTTKWVHNHHHDHLCWQANPSHARETGRAMPGMRP